MKALISPNEKHHDGARVAQLSEFDFEVAAPLFWVDYFGDKKENQLMWDGSAIVELPEPETQQQS